MKKEITIDKYRIDKSTGQVFEFCNEQYAYLFLCSFFQIGATSSNREKTIIKKIEQWKTA